MRRFVVSAVYETGTDTPPQIAYHLEHLWAKDSDGAVGKVLIDLYKSQKLGGLMRVSHLDVTDPPSEPQ